MSKNKKLKKRIRTLEEDLDTAFEAIQALELKVNKPNPFRLIAQPNTLPNFTINNEGIDAIKVVTESIKFATDFGNRLFETKVKDNDEG